MVTAQEASYRKACAWGKLYHHLTQTTPITHAQLLGPARSLTEPNSCRHQGTARLFAQCHTTAQWNTLKGSFMLGRASLIQ